jgi:chemotaxis protein MotB
MRKIINIIHYIILAGILISCVSKKKFKSLDLQYKQLEINYQNCQDSLAYKNLNIDSLNNVIASLKDSLILTQNLLVQKNLKIDSLTDEITLKTQMIEICQENLDNIKNKSSKEIQNLILSLEQLQQDLTSREQKLKEFEKLIAERDSALQSLINKLKSALKPYEDAGLEVKLKNGEIEVSLSNQLLFALGSIEIDKKGKEALAEFAKVINQYKEVNFLIYVEGHTDDVPVTNLGDIKDNWDLSVMRSTSVIRYLTKECKVNPKILVASGRGQYEPIQEGKTNEARARNRRTEILIVPKLDTLLKIIEK